MEEMEKLDDLNLMEPIQKHKNQAKNNLKLKISHQKIVSNKLRVIIYTLFLLYITEMNYNFAKENLL